MQDILGSGILLVFRGIWGLGSEVQERGTKLFKKVAGAGGLYTADIGATFVRLKQGLQALEGDTRRQNEDFRVSGPWDPGGLQLFRRRDPQYLFETTAPRLLRLRYVKKLTGVRGLPRLQMCKGSLCRQRSEAKPS